MAVALQCSVFFFYRNNDWSLLSTVSASVQWSLSFIIHLFQCDAKLSTVSASPGFRRGNRNAVARTAQRGVRPRKAKLSMDEKQKSGVNHVFTVFNHWIWMNIVVSSMHVITMSLFSPVLWATTGWTSVESMRIRAMGRSPWLCHLFWFGTVASQMWQLNIPYKWDIHGNHRTKWNIFRQTMFDNRTVIPYFLSLTRYCFPQLA